ncbi:MAG: Mycothiol S-conjugate amidase [Firmicutes bacterium ADurb.Bin419]|nr:MAG: Mycothiol S-conjugate amidase [Firmicutes bacterium ADurb.Bin419]
MKVLAIGAHPDDVEMLCAGTMAKFSKLGHEVFICHVCDGSRGSKTHTQEEIAAIRRKEAIASAAIIGAKSLTANIPDIEVVVDLESRLKIVDILRQADPDLVITHSPDDYMTDHINVSRLVFESIYCSNLGLVKTEHPPTTKLPFLYYMDTLAGLNFMPDEYVDISETIDIKIEMMMKMQSQLGWLKDMHNSDAAEFIKVVARFRGFQAGVDYAEAFTQKRMYPQGLTKRILP